jgi:hypothetical protein
VKLRLVFKTPGVVEDAIEQEMSYQEAHSDDNVEGQDCLRDLIESCVSKFVRCGEYITVEIDTETGTATVIPV